MSKIKLFIRQSWLLIVSSFFFGLLLAIADAAWTPRIRHNKSEKLNTLMSALLADAEGFQLAAHLRIDSPYAKTIETDIYKAIADAGQTVGWAFNASGFGFADKIEIVVAVDKDFTKITGFDVLSSNETPGFGDRIKSPYYRNQFAGVPADLLRLKRTGDPQTIDSDIIAITGATISSQAVVSIINSTLPSVKTQMRQKELIDNEN